MTAAIRPVITNVHLYAAPMQAAWRRMDAALASGDGQSFALAKADCDLARRCMISVAHKRDGMPEPRAENRFHRIRREALAGFARSYGALFGSQPN